MGLAGPCAAAWAGPPAHPVTPASDEGDPEGANGESAPGDAPELVAGTVAISRVEIQGLEQVSRRQIEQILEDAGIESGIVVQFPEDDRVAKARRRLAATGYFRRVTLRLDPEPSAEGEERRAKLVVDLDERPSLTVPRLYLGSSRLTPFHGGLEVEEQNFLGRSVHIGGGVVWGTVPPLVQARRQQGYRLYAEAPRLAGSKIGVLGSAWFLSASEPYQVSGELGDPNPRRYRAVDYNRIGGLVGTTFAVTPDLRLGTDFRFELVDASPLQNPTRIEPSGEEVALDLQLEDGRHQLTSLDFSLRWDGRDKAMVLGTGGRAALDVSLASPVLGSSYEYVKLVMGAAYSFRLPWRHWITPSAVGGHVVGDAPRFERFYPGDQSDWTPGREMGLIYSTRRPFDLFGTGIDQIELGTVFGRVDLEYAIPLFRRPRTSFVEGGFFFFSSGVHAIAPGRDERAARRDAGLPAAALGLNGNLGIRLHTSIGEIDLSVGNLLQRLPL